MSLHDLTLTITEEERQMLLLALAVLVSQRPGWDYACNEIALKMDNNKDGRGQMFDQLRALQG